MKSKFAKKFNHDPIRKGYSSLMKWVKEKTGNTSAQIKPDKKIYCVNISQNMLDIAKNKLKNKLKNNYKVVFIKNDLLGFFDDEFYWYIDDESKKLESLGFKVEIKRFSDLSWGIYGIK